MQSAMRIQSALLTLALLLPTSCQSVGPGDQPGFTSPVSAFPAVVLSLRTSDLVGLRILLGPESRDLLGSGDKMEDGEDRQRFLDLYDEQHSIEVSGDDSAVLSIGAFEWPFPIPAVRIEGSWFLDAEEGLEELLDRRIGQNELSTVNVCLAVVDAQLEYVARDWNGNGLHEYAQRLRSSKGTKDGLYWKAEEGEAPSPIGALFAAAAVENLSDRTEPDSYHGYRYRLLEAQGTHATGGAYGYMAGEAMIGGFALIAYPARYGETGVMSFVISHDEALYEKDLGPDGEATAKGMTAFDPDSSWGVVPTE
jgi:hypothetical protein